MISQSLAQITDRYLNRAGLNRSDIGIRAAHPGGTKILETVKEYLEL